VYRLELRSSASPRPALPLLLPQAVGLDQHILRISKLLLPLVAKPDKVSPVSLFALREPLDQFEVDLGAVLLRDHAKGFSRLMPQAELFQLLQLAQHLFKALDSRLTIWARSFRIQPCDFTVRAFAVSILN
jgi:hypothetical protein